MKVTMGMSRRPADLEQLQRLGSIPLAASSTMTAASAAVRVR
jgi:hypothetical protein